MTSTLVADLFGAAFRFVETSAFPGIEALLPEERPAVRNAIPSRVSEFAAGRYCARQALAQLGVINAPLPAGRQRAPVWPQGFVGSITHTDSYCAAVVASARDVLSVGIDAEPAVALPQELIESVCTPAERSLLERQPPEDQGLLALAVFSAKEAFFKYQFPLTHRYLEFQDVQVEFDADREAFRIVMCTNAAPELDLGRLSGRVLRRDDLILTAVWSLAEA